LLSDRLMVDALQPTAPPSGSFLQALINEDILAEDVVFNERSEAVEVVRPTYQKFADHLISRYLQDEQLDASSKKVRLAELPRQAGFLGFEGLALSILYLPQIQD